MLALAACGMSSGNPYSAGDNGSSGDGGDGGGGGGSGSGGKATLSSWSIKPSAAWVARLDQNANFSGTLFTLVYKFSDTSEITCTATMSGTSASGTLTTTGCVANPAGSGMAASTGTGFASTGGTGSYSNDGATLSLCRADTSCNDYN